MIENVASLNELFQTKIETLSDANRMSPHLGTSFDPDQVRGVKMVIMRQGKKEHLFARPGGTINDKLFCSVP